MREFAFGALAEESFNPLVRWAYRAKVMRFIGRKCRRSKWDLIGAYAALTIRCSRCRGDEYAPPDCAGGDVSKSQQAELDILSSWRSEATNFFGDLLDNHGSDTSEVGFASAARNPHQYDDHWTAGPRLSVRSITGYLL